MTVSLNQGISLSKSFCFLESLSSSSSDSGSASSRDLFDCLFELCSVELVGCCKCSVPDVSGSLESLRVNWMEMISAR